MANLRDRKHINQNTAEESFINWKVNNNLCKYCIRCFVDSDMITISSYNQFQDLSVYYN